jgi:NDP-4-keto-2,6-dideoxyhexose 3-C-methyltransferase
MKYKIKKINHCLLCKNKNINEMFSLGNLFVSNFVKKKDIKKGTRAPLKLMHCKKCSLIQLSHIAPQEIMYRRFYWYRSGVTKIMKSGLHNIFKESLKYVRLQKDDVVLDIGANDGTLLNFYKKKNFKTIGCEPANNLQKSLKKNCNFIINNFWNKKELNKILLKNRLKKPKIITAIGMFYDLEEPNKFIKDASDSLDQKGIFIAQLMCLKTMIKKNDLGNICHEHIEFYSLKSLKFLFERNGFEIFKIEENDINGGSYRIYCRKFKKGSIKLKNENVQELMKAFIKRVKINRSKTVSFINKKIKERKKVFLYGASTKGNTVLQYYDLNNNMIPFAAERSPEKWGKYTIGTGIKIISEKMARKFNPDYFFVTPWGFIKEFVEREKKWLKLGGSFIVPFPKFKVIKYKTKK